MKFEINIFNSCKLKPLPIKKVKEAVSRALAGESAQDAVLNIVYVDDKEIHKLNIQYLGHDYTTDVITFDLSEEDDAIDVFGEVYISVDTASRQAADYRVSLTDELKRLAVHGALHLCGYDDDSAQKRQQMSNLETKYIR